MSSVFEENPSGHKNVEKNGKTTRLRKCKASWKIIKVLQMEVNSSVVTVRIEIKG